MFRSPPTPLWGSNTSSSLSSDPKDPGWTFWGPEPGVGSLRRRRSPSLNPLMPTRCRSAPSVFVPAYMAHCALPRLKFRHHTTPDASSLLPHLADRAPSAVAMVAKRRCSCAQKLYQGVAWQRTEFEPETRHHLKFGAKLHTHTAKKLINSPN